MKLAFLFFFAEGIDEEVGIDSGYEKVLEMLKLLFRLKMGDINPFHHKDGVFNFGREGNYFFIHILILVIIEVVFI